MSIINEECGNRIVISLLPVAGWGDPKEWNTSDISFAAIKKADSHDNGIREVLRWRMKIKVAEISL